jgi:putative FmdB family regulatory protein
MFPSGAAGMGKFFRLEMVMPLFEFICTDCSQPFEELVRSAAAIDTVACPSCGSLKIKKKLSTFASKVSGGSSYSFSSSAPSSCSTGGT